MKKICAGLALLLSLGGCGNRTVDLIDGTYEGYFDEGDLDNRIHDVNENDKLSVRFYDVDTCEGDENCRELWAEIEFKGLITVMAFGFEIILSGPEDDIIEGITVKEEELKCSPCKLFGFKRKIKGTFGNGFRTLDLEASGIGTIPLTLIEGNDE
jgi:hypothetical protein